MYEIELLSAISEIYQACEDRQGGRSPYFFVVGAGISAPTIPLAAEIESECRAIALAHNRTAEPKVKNPLESYSHWFELAFPHPEQRQQYLKKKIKGKLISPAVFRLAHLLLKGVAGKLVVTPNFDDFLSRALLLFGEPHILCDHPNTVSRISIDSDDIQIVHVHGTYWFYDCCNLKGEIAQRAENLPTGPVTISSFLEHLLWNRSPIVLGYSGWEGDVIMTAIQRRLRSQLPHNLYWFCYKRSDLDVLPLWLRDHPNVRFNAPKSDVATVPKLSTDIHGASLAEPQDEKSGATVLQASPAQRILDSMVSSFKLDPPPLTKNPLQFFADQLSRSVSTEEGESTEGDFYALKSVVARVQAAALSEAAQSAIDVELENLRNALRSSDYEKAIEIARGIPQAQANPSQLEGLMSAAEAAAAGLADNSPAELEGYQLACQIAQRLAHEGALSLSSSVTWAKALVNAGLALGEASHGDKEIAAYDEVVQRFGDATEFPLREFVARALFSKGFALRRTDRMDEAIAAYDEVVRRFGDAAEPVLHDQVAKALVNKGVVLIDVNRTDEGTAAYDEVLRRFGETREPFLRERLARALVNKGFALRQAGRIDEAIAAYDEAAQRFGEDTEPDLRERVARALFNKAFALGQADRTEEEIAAYDDVVRRFGEATEPTLREVVARAQVNKGFSLARQNRTEEAIAAYDDVVRRFGEATEPIIHDALAKALTYKGITLEHADRPDAAVAAFDEVVLRFGNATEPALREWLAEALFNKGLTLTQASRAEEAIAAYDELSRRFGEASELALRERVAKALANKGLALGQADRNDEAISAYNDLIQRFSDSPELSLQEAVVGALLAQAKVFKQLNQTEQARSKCLDLVHRFGDISEPAIQEHVSEAKRLIEDIGGSAAATA